VTHLSVLFVASEQHIGRRLEGKVTHFILLDNRGERCIVTLRRLRWRLDNELVMHGEKCEGGSNLLTWRRVFEPLVASVIHFSTKVDRVSGFAKRVNRH
jgi:hypothetical protein